jgi:rod shape-determining protein MreD
VKIVAALVAIAAALALQTTLASLVIRGTAALDLVLIVVVYLGLVFGPVTGLLLGMTAGLIQDALSSGLIGVGGLAKTVVGFVAGLLGTQFNVASPLFRFLVFILGTVIHAVIFMGLYVLLDLRQFDSPYAAVMSQAIGNGFLGVVGAELVEWLPGLLQRRRLRRVSRR